MSSNRFYPANWASQITTDVFILFLTTPAKILLIAFIRGVSNTGYGQAAVPHI